MCSCNELTQSLDADVWTRCCQRKLSMFTVDQLPPLRSLYRMPLAAAVGVGLVLWSDLRSPYQRACAG